ncbi:MAG: ABC transporter permease [Bacteroidales bacterium]|nr:ABC transporter permease [Bacteroidales bacterium]
MKIILTLLGKEFKQIFRNRFMLPVIFIVPVIQMLILVYAASLEMKDIKMVVVDEDHSPASLRLSSQFSGSPFFRVKGFIPDFRIAEKMLAENKVDMILQFRKGFEKNLFNQSFTEVQLIINAINATEAGLISGYCSSIIMDFNNRIRSEWLELGDEGLVVDLDIIPSFWYNPLMDYKIYMFPGILVILITLIGMMLTALNLVREKEIGTTEQINVTPISKYQFLLAKLLPFWIIALFELAFGLVIGKLLFHLPTVGNMGLLFGFASVYLMVIMGIGLLLSTFSNTQLQIMFLAFFILVAFILMSGIFTPTESMPDWAQKLNLMNPMAYFMRVNRMILLKGSTFWDISREFFSLGSYAIIVLILALVNYRKTA